MVLLQQVVEQGGLAAAQPPGDDLRGRWAGQDHRALPTNRHACPRPCPRCGGPTTGAGRGGPWRTVTGMRVSSAGGVCSVSAGMSGAAVPADRQIVVLYARAHSKDSLQGLTLGCDLACSRPAPLSTLADTRRMAWGRGAMQRFSAEANSILETPKSLCTMAGAGGKRGLPCRRMPGGTPVHHLRQSACACRTPPSSSQNWVPGHGLRSRSQVRDAPVLLTGAAMTRPGVMNIF